MNASPSAGASGGAIAFFLLFVLISLGMTAWAVRRVKTAEGFFVAGHSIGALANGMAIAGDFIAAAGFLGIAGLVATVGFDGLIYAIGSVMAFPVVLFALAEPLRNLGKYTIGDVLTYRFRTAEPKLLAALSSLVTILTYLIVQMVGAGTLVHVLFSIPYEPALLVVGAIMLAYVFFGGMVATTWVQIVKCALMVFTSALMVVLALRFFGWNVLAVFHQASLSQGPTVLAPGRGVANPIDAISLAVTLLFGVASLPHVLMRVFTARNGQAARTSLFYTTCIIAVFQLMTFMLGFAAMVLVGPGSIRAADRGGNMAIPLLAEHVGGAPLLGFVAAIAFATLAAVVSGLVITGAVTISHDLWPSLRRRKIGEREQLVVAKAAIVLLCVAAILLGLAFKGQNLGYLVGLSTALPAAANFPVLVLAVFWRGLTKAGAIAGILVGLVLTVVLIVLSPVVQVDVLHYTAAFFPLRNPGIVSIPAAFLASVVVSLLSADAAERERYHDVERRILVGTNV